MPYLFFPPAAKLHAQKGGISWVKGTSILASKHDQAHTPKIVDSSRITELCCHLYLIYLRRSFGTLSRFIFSPSFSEYLYSLFNQHHSIVHQKTAAQIWGHTHGFSCHRPFQRDADKPPASSSWTGLTFTSRSCNYKDHICRWTLITLAIHSSCSDSSLQCRGSCAWPKETGHWRYLVNYRRLLIMP